LAVFKRADNEIAGRIALTQQSSHGFDCGLQVFLSGGGKRSGIIAQRFKA
jgi:hypothetical protein